MKIYDTIFDIFVFAIVTVHLVYKYFQSPATLTFSYHNVKATVNLSLNSLNSFYRYVKHNGKRWILGKLTSMKMVSNLLCKKNVKMQDICSKIKRFL